MPGDTVLINNQAKTSHSYDAIIVGSGISGGWAAKELCEKGLKVLMLERGKPLEHPNYPTATKDPWEFPHRGSLTKADKERSHIQSRHYSYREDNKHFYINDKENPYAEKRRFDWIRGDIVGGRSVLWARQCYRLSDIDFEANLRDGIATDWPIRYRDIAPWYSYVEKFIGVSGAPEHLPQLPDSEFLPPMQMNCVEEFFKQKIAEHYADRRVIMGRSANLTGPVKGRGTCQYRNLCHRGCPFGAYFSTNASTLPAAFATGNLTLRTNALANTILFDNKTQRASGVEIIDTSTGKTETFYAKILFINAATVGTAFLLLNSKSSRFPNGLGNDSDQVGRNLMDHHKAPGVSGTIEGFTDSYYFGRRPNGIYVPRFRNLSSEQKMNFIRGYGFQGGAYRGRGADPNAEIGTALKDSMDEAGEWTISLGGFGECLPNPSNRVVLNTDLKDKWGRNTLTMDAAFGDNEKAMQVDMITSATEMLQAAGAKNIHASGQMSFPGNANHEMGTARMGNDPRTSVLNKYNQMHAVKNVFITDGSCMVSSSCVNPSLTYMALTARAADFAVEELKKRNI